MSDEVRPPPVDWAAIRARRAAIAAAERAPSARSSDDGLIEAIASLRAAAEARGPQPIKPWPCPTTPWMLGETIAAGEETCDREWHHDATSATRPCPFVAVVAERERLAGILAHLARGGGEGFDGYDPGRHPDAARALDVMRAFSRGRPPNFGVFLVGLVGLGKTRLLVASHMAHLTGGQRSRYLTTPDLRALFRDAGGFEGDARDAARNTLAAIRRAHVVHLDDLGDVEGDERKRGEFSEQLKALRDNSTAAWAVAMNCTYEEAAKHPDIGRKVLDRLVDGAVVVSMKGESQRRPVQARR